MRICLCIVLASVHAARIRYISPKHGPDSEADMISKTNPFAALTLGQAKDNLGASLLKLKPFDGQKAKSALAAAITKQANVLREAIAARKAGINKDAEREFEAVLSAAISAIMTEEKAAGVAKHDKLFHKGYYRAVKAEAVAKAATEAAKKAIAKASSVAKVSGEQVVFKKLREHTELETGATVKQVLLHMQKQIKDYVKNVEAKIDKFPDMVGLEAFLDQIKAAQQQVRVRMGQPFDSELMTQVLLGVAQVMIKALYFDFQVKNQATPRVFPPRVSQSDNHQEMSEKMKSEVGLDGFLKHVITMESHFDQWKDRADKEAAATKGEKKKVPSAGDLVMPAMNTPSLKRRSFDPEK